MGAGRKKTVAKMRRKKAQARHKEKLKEKIAASKNKK